MIVLSIIVLETYCLDLYLTGYLIINLHHNLRLHKRPMLNCSAAS